MRSYGEPMSRPLTLLIVFFALFIPVIPALSPTPPPRPANPRHHRFQLRQLLQAKRPRLDRRRRLLLSPPPRRHQPLDLVRLLHRHRRPHHAPPQKLHLHRAQLAHHPESNHEYADHHRLSAEDEFLLRSQQQERLVLGRRRPRRPNLPRRLQNKNHAHGMDWLLQTRRQFARDSLLAQPLHRLHHSRGSARHLHRVGHAPHAGRLNHLHLRTQRSRQRQQNALPRSHPGHKQSHQPCEVAVLERHPKQIALRTNQRHRANRSSRHHPGIFRRPDEIQRRHILFNDRHGPAKPSLPPLERGDNLVLLQYPRPMVKQDHGLHNSRSRRQRM